MGGNVSGGVRGLAGEADMTGALPCSMQYLRTELAGVELCGLKGRGMIIGSHLKAAFMHHVMKAHHFCDSFEARTSTQRSNLYSGT